MTVDSETTTASGSAGLLILRTLWLIVGIFACATSVIMIKASESHPVMVAAYRLLMASIILTPVFIFHLRQERTEYRLEHLKRSFIPAVLLALHFISWALGARLTFAANATLIVNMVPLVMPFILIVMLRERIQRREIAGTIIALAGVSIIGISDYTLDPALLFGDFVCFVSMVLFALYLALGRANRDFRIVWLYLVPLYWIAGILCFAVAIAMGLPLGVNSLKEFALLLGIAVIPTIVGHSILNYSVKHFRGQVVSVVNLSQFIFAGALAYFIFAEIPGTAFYLTALLVVAGAWIVLRRS